MEFIELFETLQVQSMASTAECKKSFQILAAQHANELEVVQKLQKALGAIIQRRKHVCAKIREF
jgi:septum formation topological specificity factor MinE